MIVFIYTIPVAILVALSQLLIKWRTQSTLVYRGDGGFLEKIFFYCSDFYIVVAYCMALMGSFVWLMVIPRIPLSIGFPIYVGSTFLLVVLGSWFLLGEPIGLIKFFSICLILTGILLAGFD